LAQQPVSPKGSAAGNLAEASAEPTDFASTSEWIAARTRCAMSSALSPDETWIATGYGRATNSGQVWVRDAVTGKSKWHAREDRGVRSVTISPDGSLVASGNYGGQITIRDAKDGQVKFQFRDQSGSIEGLAFSSDDRRIAAGTNARVIRIWEVATGQILKTISGHTGRINSVAFSADDKWLLSASSDKSARLWNATHNSLKLELTHPAEVSTAIFLNYGTQIATSCSDGQVRIFAVDTGKLVTTLAMAPGPRRGLATSVAVAGNGKLLASNTANSIHLWDAEKGKHLATLDGHEDVAFDLTLSRDGKTLVSSSWDNEVRIWDVPSRRTRHLLKLPADDRDTTGPIRTLAVSPDGATVATAEGNSVVHLRNHATGAMQRKLSSQEGDVLAIAFSPDGKTLAAGNSNGTIQFWNVAQADGSIVSASHTAEVTAIAWSRDGSHLASASADHSIRVWNAATHKEIAVLEGHSAEVFAIAFTPDGRRLVSGSGDATGVVWDIEKSASVAVLGGHTGAVRAVAVSPDGTTIGTAGDDLTVRLWSAVSLKPRAALRGHQQPIASLAFSPQGSTLASGGMGGGIMLWDPKRGIFRKTLNGHTSSVTAVSFLPDGSGLISGSADESIRLWRAAVTNVAPLVSLPAHLPLAFAVEFSPDGKWLASGGRDNRVALRDPVTGAVRKMLSGHRGLIYDVAFSPDSESVASASADGTVKLWSVERGTQLASYNAFGSRSANIRSVAYSPDGDEIASGCEDGTIKLWNVTDQKVRRTLTGQALPVLCVNYSPDGSLLATSTGFNQQTQVAGELRLWDVKSGMEIASLEGHTTEIKRVVFDGDGRRLASVGSERTVMVWYVPDRTVETTFRADAAVTSMAFLTDRNLLAIGDNRGGVAIYDVTQGAATKRYAGHEKLVPGIAVSPNQKILATASHDGTIKLWPLQE